MARKGIKRDHVVQTFTVACGATDQDNKVDAVVPSPAATAIQMSATTKTAGTGTGTFSVQLTQGSATAVGAATAVTFINADGTAGTVHGVHPINTIVRNLEGTRLGITTVKTGTVSADATLIVQVTWRL